MRKTDINLWSSPSHEPSGIHATKQTQTHIHDVNIDIGDRHAFTRTKHNKINVGYLIKEFI